METKKCIRCQMELPLKGFHKDKAYKDGYRSSCKKCRMNVNRTELERNRTYRDKSWMLHQYCDLNKTVEEISREFSIKNETITTWLGKHGIKKRSQSASRKIMLANNPELVKKHSDELKEFYKNNPHLLTGYKHSRERKELISKDRKRYFSIEDNRIKHSNKQKIVLSNERTRLKMSLSKLGKPVWNKGLTHELDNRIPTGENHPLWQGGKSFEVYPNEFSSNLKNDIILRDDGICNLCGISNDESLTVYKRRLCVHHIDYDKNNCDEFNLITLCNSCHAKTNFNRDEWQECFDKIIANKY